MQLKTMEVPEAFWLIKRGKRQFKNECKSGRKKKKWGYGHYL